ncbi:MAG TPA: hypothetical protein VGB66_18550 [Longimicrobium sp.]|jgi:hypothetical protein
MYSPNSPFDAVEMGGPSLVRPIVDRQQGPTCGFEAVENVVQLFLPAGNNLSNGHLLRAAQRYGALLQDSTGYLLHTGGYQSLLAEFGIATTWHAFDQPALIAALQENRVAIAVVDAHQIDPRTYPAPQSGHAVVITNFVVDPRGRVVVGYVGVDSNHPGEERWWGARSLQLGAGFPQHLPLLITDSAVRWPMTADYYQRTVSGEVRPVKRVPRR